MSGLSNTSLTAGPAPSTRRSPPGSGRVTSRPRSRSPVIRSVTKVAFSVEPSSTGERVLDPVDADAQGDHAGVLGEVHPVDHERDQVQVIEAAAHQFARAPSRLRPRTGGRPPTSTWPRPPAPTDLPGGLQPVPVAARGQPGQHLLHRQLAQDLGGGEQLIGRQVQLAGPVDGPHPRPLHRTRRPPRVTDPSPVPCRYPRTLTVVLAAPARTAAPPPRRTWRPSPAGPVPTASASRPSFAAPAISAIDTITCSGHGDLPRQRVRLGTAAGLLVGVAHGGPLPSSDDLAVARHLPLGRPRAGDRHSQVLRRPGHPPPCTGPGNGDTRRNKLTVACASPAERRASSLAVSGRDSGTLPLTVSEAGSRPSDRSRHAACRCR